MRKTGLRVSPHQHFAKQQIEAPGNLLPLSSTAAVGLRVYSLFRPTAGAGFWQ